MLSPPAAKQCEDDWPWTANYDSPPSNMIGCRTPKLIGDAGQVSSSNSWRTTMTGPTTLEN
jgi:hypothetical protein